MFLKKHNTLDAGRCRKGIVFSLFSKETVGIIMGKKILLAYEDDLVLSSLRGKEIKEKLLNQNDEVFEILSLQGVEEAREDFLPNCIVLFLSRLLEEGERVVQNNYSTSTIPLLVISDSTSDIVMVRFLQNGADDYISYPFYIENVIVRIAVAMRRQKSEREGVSAGGGYLVLDGNHQIVLRQGEEIHLTPNEYKILETFMRSPNRLFSREDLIHYAFHGEFHGYDRTIDTYIKSLRKKVEPNDGKGQFIRTVHGRGYRFIKDR